MHMLLHMYSSLLVAEVNLQFDLSLIMNVLFTRWTLEQGSRLLETVWIACCVQYHVTCLFKAGDIYLL